MKILYPLLIVHALIAQNVPFEADHAVYNFLDRHESLGRINAEYWNTRPYTYDQINEMLAEISANRSSLSNSDMLILKRFQIEFNRDFEEEGITLPWSKSTLRGIRHSDDQKIKPFFMTYKQGDALGWINWTETFRMQHNGKSSRGYYTDHLGIYGVKGSISFTSQFTYERVTKNDDFDALPESYKEGYVLERDYIDWINWDYPTSSLIYSHKDFTLGIHRQPVYWGYSPTNSPILSDNVYPLPHIQWTTEVKHLRYKFLHARLSPNESPLKDTLNIRRNLSAHRVEFDINPNFEFAFSEMIIYAYRDFELAYLNPVNFLFAEEHVQGDLDNLLMALEFKWRVLPGLTSYGTWLLDELDFFKLFSGWWGNKFVFQIGAIYYPKSNLPSLNLEYTAARPWTYSHEYPVNSFTSAGRILGLQVGPNTQMLHLGTDWQLGPKLFVQAEINFLQRGNDPGANVLNSYSGPAISTGGYEQFLTGTIRKSSEANFKLDYYLTKTTSLMFYWEDGNYSELGIKLDW
ncbi:hypothetical protein HQ531_11940 [bacterium]|nr:hypothetical protein [bacterium]